jgi:DNA-binding transcriptional MerR regulator
MYRRADVDVMLTIRQLVRDEGYRIEGARKRLRALHGEPLELPEAAKQQLERVASAVRQELEALEALARSALGASST